ncbi:MAG: dienelactone hydrolase family protein [Terracidiphilus sp.]
MKKVVTAGAVDSVDRRTCLKSLGALALAGIPNRMPASSKPESSDLPAGESNIGTLFPAVMELANQCNYPLSWLERDYSGPEAYRHAVREKVLELFHYAPPPVARSPELVERWETPEYVQEKILFSTTPWFRVPACVLIPKGRKGPRPAIVDLHSHGGMFVYGKEKVMPMPEGDSPAIANYRQENYEGRSTSLALCRRGYVVISIDSFYFGERRCFFGSDAEKYGLDRSKYSLQQVESLNRRAAAGEATLFKSLCWAGATWQGIVHWDDLRTVDYLVSRPEVDPSRIGCVGISMGGYRTDFLAALEDRIQCAVSVGWMSALRPMIRSHADTHSFIHFLPGLTRYLDLPDLIGCMVPKPLMVQQCSRDELYPMDGMKEALRKLDAIYAKTGASSKFTGRFYDRPHTFSLKMQEDAFDWLDRWLKP